MVETAQIIRDHMDDISAKIVILMWSSIPYLMKYSDAEDNMKFVLQAADELWVNPLLEKPINLIPFAWKGKNSLLNIMEFL